MKKLLTLAALLGAATVSYGQGYIAFANPTGATTVRTNGTVVAAAGGPVGSWYYALLWAPTTVTTVDASLAGWTFGGMATNTATSGRMDGRNSTDGSAAAVAGLTGTSTADFVIVGWSANWGSDWTTVFAGRPLATAVTNGRINAAINGATAGWYGISPVATGSATGGGIPLAPNGGPYNTIFGTGAGFIGSWNLNYYTVVPEPSTFALAGLGAAALMIFRRRK